MTDPRPRYMTVGTDTQGADHIYRTVDETVLVVEADRVTHRVDLGGKSIDRYVRFVRDDERGWAARSFLADDEDWAAELAKDVAAAIRNPQPAACNDDPAAEDAAAEGAA